MKLKRDIKLGSKIKIFLILIFFSNNYLFAEDKITSTPLINLDKIKPSFEELEVENEKISIKKSIKEKKKIK